MNEIVDVHTHHHGRPDAVVSLSPEQLLAGEPDTPFSLSLHPWYLSSDSLTLFDQALERYRHDSLLRAIGECGLDLTHLPAGKDPAVALAFQQKVFLHSLRVAKALELPVVVHCVGQWAAMIEAVRTVGNEQVIVHGFRKGPQLARQLLRAGFSISLGEKFNPDVARLVPKERLFFETDESETDIWIIRQKVLSLRDNLEI